MHSWYSIPGPLAFADSPSMVSVHAMLVRAAHWRNAIEMITPQRRAFPVRPGCPVLRPGADSVDRSQIAAVARHRRRKAICRAPRTEPLCAQYRSQTCSRTSARCTGRRPRRSSGCSHPQPPAGIGSRRNCSVSNGGRPRSSGDARNPVCAASLLRSCPSAPMPE